MTEKEVKKSDYESLKELSKKINKKIFGLLKEGGKLQFKELEEEYRYLDPIRFDGNKKNVKYLIINFNPSLKDNTKPLKKELLEIGNYGEILKKKELEKIKNIIIFPYFYKKHFELIKQIDKNLSLFWEDADTFNEIFDYLKESEKNKKHLNLKKEHIDILEKIKENINPNASNFMIFSELLYFRHSKQKDIQNLINKNPELKELIIKFLKIQIEYYKPEIIIITNAFVSKFFEKELKGKDIDKREISDIPTTEYYNSTKVFLSTMFSSGNIDNYSLKRLQNEIHNDNLTQK